MQHQSMAFNTLDLPGGTLVPFSSTPGERLRVLCGRVWLTEEGDLRDAFAVTGEEVVLGGHGLVVLEALTPARVQLLESQSLLNGARRSARRLARWLSELWSAQPRPPVAACSSNPALAQALAQFDGSLGLVQRVKVQAGCAGSKQALA